MTLVFQLVSESAKVDWQVPISGGLKGVSAGKCRKRGTKNRTGKRKDPGRDAAGEANMRFYGDTCGHTSRW